ncbi:MAG: DUF805 domain-containing protein [Betaproteobacteria bacterium]|nr:DUF805 domain-containing protein [Betaproteobacteria bacterium]
MNRTSSRTFAWLLLSFRGRLGRARFCFAAVPLAVAFAAIYAAVDQHVGGQATLALNLPLLWILGALSVKRLRDRARSPWWLLIVLVPVLGPLWLGIELALFKGTDGENQYGADPLDDGADYLEVK